MTQGTAEMEWLDRHHMRIGDTEFVLQHSREDWADSESTSSRFILAKTRNMIERHVAHAPTQVQNVVDLGIFRGGSVALLQKLFSPRRLVALDLITERVAAIDEFVVDHSLEDVVHLHYGTDQADRPRLLEILEEEFGDEPVDLVIDDCSHLYGPTRVSLNVLLPRLRPGGAYLIEDWRNQPPGDTPLFKLIEELVTVAAAGRGLIREIHVQGATVYLIRGDSEITDPAFDLRDAYPPQMNHDAGQRRPSLTRRLRSLWAD